MNKGLSIRNKKIQKNLKKCNEIKEDQLNLCRFVSIKYENIQRVNGKYRHLGSVKADGLQIKNRVYLLDGKYKMVNGKSVKIKKIYDDIPTWATDELISKYNKLNIDKSCKQASG